MTGGGVVPVSEMYDYPISIARREVRAQLIVVPLPGFDVVLGIDWLSK